MVGRTEGTITSWYAIIDEGAELWEVYSNGHEVLRAVFKNNKFQAIKEPILYNSLIISTYKIEKRKRVTIWLLLKFPGLP